MNTEKILIYTFFITALWDIILRWVAEERFPELPKPFDLHTYDFVVALKPYFKYHTLLAAALIAGFVGALTQYFILLYTKPEPTLYFAFVTFVISALIGYPMEKSGLFPILSKTYYKDLGRPKSFIADGISGLIVQSTLLLFLP